MFEKGQLTCRRLPKPISEGLQMPILSFSYYVVQVAKHCLEDFSNTLLGE